MNPSGYDQYKEQTIMTMTPGELLLLLYDELIKRLTRAKIAIDAKDWTLYDQSVQRSKEIVEYLRATLDYKYDIAKELDAMYDFFLFQISRMQAGRRKEVIDDVIPLVRDLREAYEQAGKQVENQ